jgi:Secretion system C-terminal sorting domain
VLGQIEITGDLIAPLPADFIGLAEFSIIGNPIGTSNIVADFLVTNPTALIDEDPTNNTATLQYTVTTPLPVSFSSVSLRSQGCAIGVRFTVAAETNLSHYTIETSYNGIHFTKVGQLPALGQSQYEQTITPTNNLNTGQVVYVRIQSSDIDKKIQYSDVKSIAIPCVAATSEAIQVFPNPLPHAQGVLHIKTKPSVFKGPCTVSIMDCSGRCLIKKQVSVAGSFTIETRGLAAGQYMLTIQSSSNKATATLPLQLW